MDNLNGGVLQGAMQSGSGLLAAAADANLLPIPAPQQDGPIFDEDLRITVASPSVNVDRDAARDLAFTEDNLNENMQKQASVYAYWSILQQKAEADIDRAKFECSRVEADISQKIRTGAIEIPGGSVKLTEGMVTMMIDQDVTVKAARLAVVDASYARNMIKSVVRAMEHKKDMMLSMALNKRQELKTLGSMTVHGDGMGSTTDPMKLFAETFPSQ